MYYYRLWRRRTAEVVCASVGRSGVPVTDASGRVFAGTVRCRVFNRFPPGEFGAAAVRESRWKAKTASVRLARVRRARPMSPPRLATALLPVCSGARARDRNTNATTTTTRRRPKGTTLGGKKKWKKKSYCVLNLLLFTLAEDDSTSYVVIRIRICWPINRAAHEHRMS